MKETGLNVRMTQELSDKFSEICKEGSINKSDLVRKLIKNWIAGQTKSWNGHINIPKEIE